MKRILIDAKWLFDGPVSGKVVVENILHQLEKKYLTEYEITLLLDSRDTNNIEKFSGNGFKVMTIWGRINLISNMLILPFLLLNKRIDIGIFQNYIPLFSKLKSVVYIHDIIYETNPEYFTLVERIYFKPVRLSALLSDQIVTISENEKKRLISFNYGNEEKITVIYNGVNRLSNYKKGELHKVSSPNSLPAEYVLYVGRLNDRKNIYNLIKSFEFVNPALSLVIVGKKDWKNEKIESALRASSISEKVYFTGYVSDQELVKLFKEAEIFAYVSFEEGFGLPPLEAMTFGLPVVVSSTSCMPEVCEEAGTYVDPNKAKDIADGINKVYSDRVLREKKVEEGFKQVRKFSWERSVDRLTNLIDSIEV